MYIINIKTDEKIECFVEEIHPGDFQIVVKNFSNKFDWKKEARFRQVFKLVTSQSKFIHGLISIIEREDHLELQLIENAKINFGTDKLYDRVAGNLIAYAAFLALEKFEGYMIMKPKTQLVNHYTKAYGFSQIGHALKMISVPSNSRKLVALYHV